MATQDFGNFNAVPNAMFCGLGFAAMIPAMSVIFSVLIVYTVARTGAGDIYNTYLIQPFLMVRDFFENPDTITTWLYSPANYAFPDLVIAAILLKLKIAWLYLPIAYAGVLMTGYACATGAIVSSLCRQNYFASTLLTSAMLMAIFVFGAAVSGTAGAIITYIASPYVHSGAMLCGFISIAIVVRRDNTASEFEDLALIVLSAFAAYSDILYVVWFLVPLAIVGFFHPRRNDSDRKKLTLKLVAAVVAAIALDRILRPRLVPIERNYSMTLLNVRDHLVMSPLRGDIPMTIVVALTIIMTIRSAYILKLRWSDRCNLSRPQTFLLILTGVQWTAILAPIITGYLVYPPHFRYSMPMFIIPFLWCLSVAGRHLQATIFNRAAWIVGVLLSALSILLYPSSSKAAFAITHPNVATCLLDHGLSAGYADYWLTKQIIFFTDYRISVVPLNDGGRILLLAMNRRWIERSADGSRPFSPSFVIVDRLRPPDITRRYGAPHHTIKCGSSEVWLYATAIPVYKTDMVMP